jgi:hypothetical protein
MWAWTASITTAISSWKNTFAASVINCAENEIFGYWRRSDAADRFAERLEDLVALGFRMQFEV